MPVVSEEFVMSEGQRPQSRLRLARWTRVYGSSLRETFPVDDGVEHDLVTLLEQADRRRSTGQNSADGSNT